MAAINLQELFDFSDDTPLTEVIAKMEKLSSVYDNLVAQAQKNSQKYSDSLGVILSSVTDLESAFTKLDATSKKDQEQIAKSAASMEELASDNETYTKSLKDVEAQIKMLTDQQAKLQSAKDKIASSNKAEAGSINDLKKQLKDATDAYNKLGDATDDSVKQDSLDKIKELSKAVNDSNKAVTSAKKAVDVVAGSYNDLSARVNAAKKQLKDMEGGIGSQSKEFKDLQAFVKNGSDELKEFDASLGDNQRSVGDYTGALDTLIPGLGATVGGFKAVLQASLAFAASPVGLIILGIAAAIGSLTAYFKSSEEAEDQFNQVTAVLGVILDNLLGIVIAVGKAIYQAFTGAGPVVEFLTDLFYKAKDAITAAFNDPVQALKDLGKLIYDNIVSRLQGIIALGPALAKIFSGKFKEGFKDAANAAIQIGTGIKDGVEKIEGVIDGIVDKASAAFKKIRDEANAALAIAKLEAEFRRATIADIIDDSETELKVNKDLAIVKDKLRFSDEDRLTALRAANKLLSDQVKGDVELAQLELKIAKDTLALRLRTQGAAEGTFEENKKIAELQAKVNDTESAFFQAQKRRLSEENALVNEIIKTRQEKVTRERDSETALNKYLASARIAANNQILADEESSLENRIIAIQENADDEAQIAAETAEKDLSVSRQAARDRVQLSSDTLDEIYGNEKLSSVEVEQLLIKAQDDQINNDAAYVNERNRIAETYADTIKNINQKEKDLAATNYFTILARDFDRFNNNISQRTNEALADLNEKFLSGEVSTIARYNFLKQGIQEEGQKEALNSRLAYLKKELEAYQKQGKDVSALLNQISQTELALNEKTAEQTIAQRQAVAAKVYEIGQGVADFAQAAFNADIQRNIDAATKNLETLTEAKDARLRIVGDDAQAQAAIQQDFANKQKAIQAQINAEKRKAAIFDKAKNAAETIINTSRAVVATLPNIPLAVLVGAIGALNLGKILATPIPSFYTGVDASPETWANVGEKGRELAVDKQGKLTMYNKPQVAYLKKDTRIFNNADTERIASMLGVDSMIGSNQNDTSVLAIARADSAKSNREVVAALAKNAQEVTEAINNIPKDYYDEAGFRRYERAKNGRVRRLDDKYRLQ